jgi:ribonucleoside-triphosphate reductase
MIQDEVSTYIHLSKYSRWMEDLDRREAWDETVDRLKDFWIDRLDGFNGPIDEDGIHAAIEAVRNKEVMPSMRSLMTAGKALERDHAAGFNCAAIAVNHPRVFDEIFYLLMCGSGVGYSVERQYINNLPEVSEDFHDTETTLTIRDSKIGWAKGLKELIALLYNGDIPNWDLSRIRPAGARLKTFGGRASGPDPLDELFRYCVRVFTRAKGRKLNSLECHDLVCKIANTVIVGSVRRSACISLSNLTDDRMRRAKMGEWYLHNPERALANNSVAYTEKPDLTSFLKEFRSLYQSKAGERGIVNKEALSEKAEQCGREYRGDYLLNP